MRRRSRPSRESRWRAARTRTRRARARGRLTRGAAASSGTRRAPRAAVPTRFGSVADSDHASHDADQVPAVAGVEAAQSPRPRPPEADGDCVEYSSHSSARNGRWNHIAWSSEAIEIVRRARAPARAGRARESSSVMSEAYVRTQTCSSGSSGSTPSARIHTRLRRRRAARVAAAATAGRRRSAGRSAAASTGTTRPRPAYGRRSRSSSVGSVSGRRHVGHRRLVLEAACVELERRRQREDRLAVLDGDHPAGGERAAVAHPVDLVEDRHRRVAGPEEVRVQRVDAAVRRARCGRRPPAPARRPGRRRPAASATAGSSPRKRSASMLLRGRAADH